MYSTWNISQTLTENNIWVLWSFTEVLDNGYTAPTICGMSCAALNSLFVLAETVEN